MTTNNPKQECLSCRWADYLKTPTGKPRRHAIIICQFPTQSLAGKVAEFKRSLPSSMQHVAIPLFAYGMSQDGGADCPTWEAEGTVP